MQFVFVACAKTFLADAAYKSREIRIALEQFATATGSDVDDAS